VGGRSLTLLHLANVAKSYGGVRALDGVDLDLAAGEIHALVGENGAGKSTLLRILTGAERADSGRIELDGREIRPPSPHAAQHLGLAAIHQEVGLLGELSLAENLFLGRHLRRSPLRLDWSAMERRARERLLALGLDVDVRRKASSFPIAVQQLAAIARALDLQARCLVLDEPTSSLDRRESEQLFARLRELRAGGLALVFVSHALDEVFALADRISVLRAGRKVATHRTDAIGREELVREMLGRALPTQSKRGAVQRPAGPPRLAARGLARRGAIAAFELELRAGEVVALAGLLGSGRSEIARLLFGADRADAGALELDGRPARVTSPRDGVRLALAFLPEDRRSEGVLPRASLRDNLLVALAAKRSRFGFLRRRERERIAAELIERLGIVCASADQPIGTLSGGNQQKALVARWLATEPRVWIADEPTRGVDVGARAQIERELLELAASGAAVLFVSTSLDEVERLADRALVLRARAVVGELSGAEISAAQLVRQMASGEAHEG
jgi:galactofuranose transport system ATP-binding protein